MRRRFLLTRYMQGYTDLFSPCEATPRIPGSDGAGSMTGKSGVHVGTSGWHCDHWRGPFYPPEVPGRDFLKYYAGRFRTVEINNTFYRLPREETLAQWRDDVPAGFLFAVKGSRFITHMKKPKDPEGSLAVFLERVRVPGRKLGPILFPLPPGWQCNPERFSAFLDALPVGRRYAFEFRDPSWYREETFRALAEHGAAFCIFELAGHLSPKEVTANFVYIRLHGPEGPYRGRYDDRVLEEWAGAFSSWRRTTSSATGRERRGYPRGRRVPRCGRAQGRRPTCASSPGTC